MSIHPETEGKGKVPLASTQYVQHHNAGRNRARFDPRNFRNAPALRIWKRWRVTDLFRCTHRKQHVCREGLDPMI